MYRLAQLEQAMVDTQRQLTVERQERQMFEDSMEQIRKEVADDRRHLEERCSVQVEGSFRHWEGDVRQKMKTMEVNFDETIRNILVEVGNTMDQHLEKINSAARDSTAQTFEELVNACERFHAHSSVIARVNELHTTLNQVHKRQDAIEEHAKSLADKQLVCDPTACMARLGELAGMMDELLHRQESMEEHVRSFETAITDKIRQNQQPDTAQAPLIDTESRTFQEVFGGLSHAISDEWDDKKSLAELKAVLAQLSGDSVCTTPQLSAVPSTIGFDSSCVSTSSVAQLSLRLQQQRFANSTRPAPAHGSNSFIPDRAGSRLPPASQMSPRPMAATNASFDNVFKAIDDIICEKRLNGHTC